ncbi:ABC transporter ATP-binding protein [Kribbella sp. NPDC051718]|uniref:ABC transporter ATP-binding protein n=1 Tax=Kribbella sp. NPDC051718 TaxID=3155168 RepID=UPI0034485E21
MSSLEVVQLSKRFGARTAVDALSFSTRQGDIIGLLGPNGAGKTTTIRLLTTILRPSGGSFSLTGIPGEHQAAIRERIGVLPESAGYPARQTGWEYLRYSARLFGLGRVESANVTDRLLADVGLSDRAGSRISTYSRGMRQRLGIARALVNDPAVVFLDEPTLGLDPAGQREILAAVRDIAQRRGATVLLSTHTLTEVEQICTNLLILNRGKLLAAGTVSDVIATVGARRSGRLRVAPDLTPLAQATLDTVNGLKVTGDPDHPGELRLEAISSARDPWDNALRALLDARIAVLAFDTDATRLSDAFLSLTEEDQT